MSIKKIVMFSLLGVLLLIALACLGQMFETVGKGTYQIKQAAITGKMSAKMTPGIWLQAFGDIDTWPKAETYFFTHDNDTKGDSNVDTSIEVRFNDGSVCKISGTMRIIMPTTASQAIALVTDRGHKTYKDVQEKLIKPTLRNVLRSTANLMSARESYSEKRLDFVTWTRDQIEKGVYKTEEERQQVEDLVTGEKTWKMIKTIRTDSHNNPLHESNPLEGTGIVLKNFEIKTFVYEKKVQEQIAKQQEARMAVETAKAKAEEARQEELKAVAEGKMKVAKAKYEEEQNKVRAVVQAQKDKEVQELDAARDKNVAVIAGEKRKEVAQLDKDAAALKKQELIMLGEGEAAKKRAIMQADGALQQKLNTYEKVNGMYANAIKEYKGNWVPTVNMGGDSGSSAGGANDLIHLLTTKTALDLGLDLNMKANK